MKVEWLRMMSVEKALLTTGLFVLFVQNHFELTVKNIGVPNVLHPLRPL